MDWRATLIVAAVLMLMGGAAMAQAAEETRFYVSLAGDDRWSGKLAEPDAGRTDGPFATVQRALAAIRELRRTDPDMAGPATVYVRGGIHYLREPIILTPEDSGTPASPIIIRNFPGELPVLSGGRRVSGWKVGSDGVWRVTLPEAAGGAWPFTQMWVNGERRWRPRLPKQGYHYIRTRLSPTLENAGKGYDRFGFYRGQIDPAWHNLQDVELLCFQIWTMARMRIRSVDEAALTVSLTGHTRGEVWYTSFETGNRFLVENVREALTEPGEWYLDTRTGELSYIPRPGEDPASSLVIAPRLQRLVEIKGDLEGGHPVEHIRLEGLTFAHTHWQTPPEGYTYPQAEAGLRGAITADGARDILMRRCRITHTGEYALDLGAGCKRVRVERCTLTDLGAGGVKIGTQAYSDKDEMVASHNIIRDCVIANGGRMHPAAVGVWIGHSSHNTISHNDIADFYYTGVSVGWSWGYGPSNGHHNLIEHNHIHRIGQGVLSDMGGIYTLGLSSGSVLKGNRIHDVDSYGYGGWGIYYDEGTFEMTSRDNVVFRTKSAGFHQHYGKDNIVENNIFAFGREAQVMRTRAEEHMAFTFRRNIVYWKDAPLLGSNWQDDRYRFESNLYWDASGKEPRFLNWTWDEWRARGQDEGSIIADPMFVDPARDDFRLRPGSPAVKIGFRPFDQSDFGPRDGRKASLDAQPAFPVFPGPRPPLPVDEGFEASEPGEQSPSAVTYEEPPAASIRVSDEQAATGRHSLKIQDAPGLRQHFLPYLFFSPGFRNGEVAGSFALRIEQPGVLYHEWRDSANPYRGGPYLRVEKDGTLRARERELMRLPQRQWVRLSIVCPLEGDGRTYAVTVEVAGQPPRTFSGLEFDQQFRSLDWFGFVADGDSEAVFYLDDIRVSAAPE